MNKLVITGGAGFIGSHLAEHFAGRYAITLYDNLDRNSLRFVTSLRESPHVDFVNGDVLDAKSVRAALDGASVVIHCAAIAGVSNYYVRSFETLRVNVLGTFNVLDAIAAAGADKMIYFSSSEIYGTHAENVSEDANAISGPTSEQRWVYAVSKLTGEHATLRYGESNALAATIVRPFNIYGPRQIGEGAISNFAHRLSRGEPIEIHGTGEDVRSWCYVTDLVSAVDRILDSEAVAGKRFNIGNPASRVTTRELAEMMISLNGGGDIAVVPQTHAPIPVRTPNISLATHALGYQPRVGLREGLQLTLDWFRKNSS